MITSDLDFKLRIIIRMLLGYYLITNGDRIVKKGRYLNFVKTYFDIFSEIFSLYT